MLHTPELRAAIESLYSVFRRYQMRNDMEPCPCCHTAGEGKQFHAKPLNKLSRKDLRDYAADAIYTWGTGNDFKHFLPRLFELVIETQKPGHEFVEPAMLFTKLNYESWCSLRWQTWPDDEKQAISSYLRALWKAVLNSNPEDLPWDGAYGWIEGIAQAEHDLSQYLHEWLEASSVNAHRNLASMILNHNPTNIKRPAGGFWEGHREQWEQLVAWARLPVVRQKLTDGLDRWGGEPFANEFLEAAVLLP